MIKRTSLHEAIAQGSDWPRAKANSQEVEPCVIAQVWACMMLTSPESNWPQTKDIPCWAKTALAHEGLASQARFLVHIALVSPLGFSLI